MSDTIRTAIRPAPARRRVRVRRGVAAAAVVALAVAVSACSPRETGAAAVVGDRRITNEQLDQALSGLREGNPELVQGEGVQNTVLFYLVISPYVLAAAQEAGVAASQDEARTLLPKATDPDPLALQVLRTYLSVQKLQQENKPELLDGVKRDVQAAHPRVSPRFGRFDTSSMSVAAVQPNWLATPAVPTGQPSGQPTDQPTDQSGTTP